MIRSVLVVEDDKAVREALGQTLELADLHPVLLNSFVAAKDMISTSFDGVILSDIRMPGRDGFHLLEYAQDQDPDLPVVLLSGEGDIPMAVKAMGQGAFDFLEKPCAPQDLVTVLGKALQAREQVQNLRQQRAQAAEGDPAARMIFGVSAQAEQLRNRVRAIANAGSDALIIGPAGSGISKIAEVAHLCSARSKAAFEKRAGAALDPDGLRSALQDAKGGSLFVDDLAGLPLESQRILTEVLDDGARARVFLGANPDVAAAVKAGRVNADLFYRLSGMSVRIPALVERREDIPVLFCQYVAQACEQAGLQEPDISPEHLSDLMARDWPGNARAVMSEAMRFALGLSEDPQQETDDMGLAEQMQRVEKSLLEQALRRADGRASAAAKALKLPRKTFYDKLTRHGIRPESFRTLG